LVTFSQTLSGYSISDFLVSAVHPNGCTDLYVTGPPDDLTWVNFSSNTVMTGSFGSTWTNLPGQELLLETSYHPSNYNVRLLLSTGLYSATHIVQEIDWTIIADTTWTHLYNNCLVGNFTAPRCILPLDFISDFGLNNTDIVIGIEITFLSTIGAPDLAGVYIVSTPPLDLNLGNDTTLCQGQNLTLNGSILNATYLWQDNSTNAMFNVTQAGTYWVTATTPTGVLTDTIVVNYTQAPVVFLGNDTSLCAGENLLLSSNNVSGSYQWQDNSTNSTFNVVQQGVYWLMVTENNCSVTDSIIVNYTTISNLNFGNDSILCSGDSLLLNAPFPNALYHWQDNSTNAYYNVTQAGTYWVQVTSNNCTASDTINVSYSPIPIVNLGVDTTLCEGSSLLLNALNSNASYLWQNNLTNSSLNVNQSGTYWVVVTSNNCSATDAINVSYLPRPTFSLGNDTTLCEGENLLLNVTNLNATYQWQNNSSFSSFNVSKEGVYWLVLTENNCSSTDSIVVSYISKPFIGFASDTALCDGESLLLEVGNNNATYLWQDNSTLSNYHVNTSGTYKVIVTVNNCIAQDSIIVTYQNCESILLMPNIFTPNNDGNNDFFKALEINSIENCTLKILNRWGQSIFETNDIYAGWDGTYNGKKCTPGTYYWIVEYTTKSSETKTQSGFVTVLN